MVQRSGDWVNPAAPLQAWHPLENGAPWQLAGLGLKGRWPRTVRSKASLNRPYSG